MDDFFKSSFRQQYGPVYCTVIRACWPDLDLFSSQLASPKGKFCTVWNSCELWFPWLGQFHWPQQHCRMPIMTQSRLWSIGVIIAARYRIEQTLKEKNKAYRSLTWQGVGLFVSNSKSDVFSSYNSALAAKWVVCLQAEMPYCVIVATLQLARVIERRAREEPGKKTENNAPF